MLVDIASSLSLSKNPAVLSCGAVPAQLLQDGSMYCSVCRHVAVCTGVSQQS
jgi:hypothetical protein